MHRYATLTGFDAALKGAVADVNYQFIAIVLGLIASMIFINPDRDATSISATTDGGSRIHTVAIVQCAAIIFVERVACQTIGCHVAGKGQRNSLLLTNVLHNRHSGNNAIALDQQRPTL